MNASWKLTARPLLVELADAAADVLRGSVGLEHDLAEHAAYLIVRRICHITGGTQVYVPKEDSITRHERDDAIMAAWNGGNTRELARQFGLTENCIGRILAQRGERPQKP
jgi:Mor family transcriptional regulator